MKIAQGGTSWICSGFIITSICLVLFTMIESQWKLILLFFTGFFLLISFLLVVFFRDPVRTVGSDIVAAADGYIQSIETIISDEDVGSCIRIATFMNIHNVHVNRASLEGTIEKITHIPGGHLPAFTKDSERNERLIILLKTSIGLIKIVQIAGTLARRIVPFVSEGQSLKKGDKIGLIRLGSRVDVYLPEKNIKRIVVKHKQKVKAGVDTIATCNA